MKTSVKNLVAGALMAALCLIFTAVLPIRTIGQGYVHLGDMIVLLCGFLPGGAAGMLAAAIGSSMADLYVGASVYAVPTFFIKGIMVLAVWLMTRNTKPLGLLTVAAFIVAEMIMLGGYFLFDFFFFGIAEVGILGMILSGLPQAAFGIVAGYLVLASLVKTGYIEKYRNL